MHGWARLLAAGAILGIDGALLAGWAGRPTVPLEAGETVVALSAEGGAVTAVVQAPRGRRLVRDGRVLAESGPGQRLSLVAAQLPLMLGAPDGGRVLLLGWGGGAAAASALSHPIAALDVVEPEAGLIEASAALLGRPAPADRRMRVIRSGFAEHLARPGPAYRAIIVDAEADESLLRLAKTRLEKHGFLSARVNVARLEGEDGLPAALRAALRHYPLVSVWSVVDGKGVLLASRRPARGDAGLDRAYARAGSWLKPLGLSYPATLLSLEAAGERTARELAWRPPPDLRPFSVDDRAAPSGRRRLLLSSYLQRRKRALQPREYLEILLHPRSPEERAVFRGLLEEWVRRYPRDPRGVAFLLVVEEQEGHAARVSALRGRLDALRRRTSGRARGEIIVPAG